MKNKKQNIKKINKNRQAYNKQTENQEIKRQKNINQ